MADKVTFWFPLRFKEKDLDGTIEGARMAIQDLHGEEVLLSDTHYSENELTFAKLRFDPMDKQCYSILVPLSSDFSCRVGRCKEVRLHYHDLERLMVGGSHKSHYRVMELDNQDPRR